MTQQINTGLIADHNAQAAARVNLDYETLGEQLARRGVDIAVLKADVAKFAVAVPSWGVGTGGTITGVSRYIKNTAGKPILSVAVEPIVSPVITQALAGEEIKPSPRRVVGVGAGFGAEEPGPVDGRPGGTGERRGVQGHGLALDAGGGDFVRYFLWGGDGRGGTPGGEAGNAGQDHRRGAAGLR